MILTFTYSRFTLTTLTYILLWISCCLVTIGAHYSFEAVPPFNWLRDAFNLQRNHFDRVVHFGTGVTIAILFREILIRKTSLQDPKWIEVLSIIACLAFGAFIELGEFISSVIAGISAEQGLGEQGDRWDTHWDLSMLLIGGILSILILRRYHQTQLQTKRNA